MFVKNVITITVSFLQYVENFMKQDALRNFKIW
jgi:hypothetical protein